MRIVKCGLSQGSILGSLLFLILVNYLNNSTKVHPVLFADDTNLFCSDDNIRTLFETANHKLNQINDCFLANKPSLDVEKKYVLFHELTDQHDIPLKLLSLQLNGNIIERKKLSLINIQLGKKHKQLIENKVSKNVGVLYKTSKLINSKCLL